MFDQNRSTGMPNGKDTVAAEIFSVLNEKITGYGVIISLIT